MLAKLIKSHELAKNRISDAISNNSSFEHVQELDRKMRENFESLAIYSPRSPQEHHQKLNYFAQLFSEEVGYTSRVCDVLIEGINEAFKDHTTANPDQYVADDPIALFSTRELVQESNDRVSLISRDYRYVDTSRKNGEFYERQPSELVGRHVADVIGRQRFENRAQRFFDKSFSGERQIYFHALDVGGTSKIFCCEMIPLRCKENGCLGSLVAINDVTENFSGGNLVVQLEAA